MRQACAENFSLNPQFKNYVGFFSESVYKTVLRHSFKALLRGQCFELNRVWGVFVSVHIFEQDCNELGFFFVVVFLLQNKVD